MQSCKSFMLLFSRVHFINVALRWKAKYAQSTVLEKILISARKFDNTGTLLWIKT